MGAPDPKSPKSEDRGYTVFGDPEGLFLLSILRWIGKLGPIGRFIRRILTPTDDGPPDPN